MATIMIQNVPENVAQRIWSVVTFTQVRVAKRRNTGGKLLRAINDPDNTASEWMSWEEFLTTLRSWTWK